MRRIDARTVELTPSEEAAQRTYAEAEETVGPQKALQIAQRKHRHLPEEFWCWLDPDCYE